MKQNFRFTICFDGTRYYGWEHQPTTDMTIQGKIETVLAKMVGVDMVDRGMVRASSPKRWRTISLVPISA